MRARTHIGLTEKRVLSVLSVPCGKVGMMKRKELVGDGPRIKAALARLDETATTYERKWGVNRLQNLVDQELAEVFRRQLSKLNAALIKHTADAVLPHVEGMIKGWRALDAAADSAGATPIDSAAWEVVTPAGRRIAFVSDIRAYKALKRDGWELWSAQEVANIIDKFHSEIDWDASEALRQTKKLFPGAEVKGVRPKATLDDAIPF